MPERSNLSSLLTALALALPLLAAAQTSPPPLTAAERAQREADRVFSVIKFHTIRSKPAAETTSKPARAPAPAAHRPAPSPVNATAPAAEPTETNPVVSTGAAQASPLTAATSPTPAAAPSVPDQADEPAGAAPTMEPAPEADEPEEVPLRMQNFVAPVLTPAVQATLGAGTRHIRVRLTVEADGTVRQAEAAANVPRRLAKPATDAILQWRFAPLPQARTADVEIAFLRD